MWWAIAGAVVGGITGAISTWDQGKKNEAALRHQKESAWQQYLLGKDYSDTQFSLQKSEALEQLGVQRANLNTQLGLSMDEFNTGLLGQAYGMQDAQIGTASSIGMSLAAEGASGTRGNAANELVRAYAAQGLERNIELQERQNSDYLNRMTTGATMTASAIDREQAAWQPGGYRTRAKEAQDAYNLGVANLAKDNFNWQIDQAQPGFLDYFTAINSGAASGMSMGMSASNYSDAKNWGGNGNTYQPNYDWVIPGRTGYFPDYTVNFYSNAWNGVGK